MTLHAVRSIPRLLTTIARKNTAPGQVIGLRCLHINLHPLYNKDNRRTTSSIILHGFQNVENKKKDSFLAIIESYESALKSHQGCVEFIKAAMKYMKEFGVHEDLETYKKLVNVLPKGKYIPKNMLQATFQHYPAQQQTIIDLLDQMEHFGVIPDREMEDILLNIFGHQGLPLRKYWRMMYWMPKFKYVNPWLASNAILNDPRLMASFALNRMTNVDPTTKISTFETKEIPDSPEDTWVVSAMSHVQQELLAALPLTETLFVEGPYRVWVIDQTIDYFVLRGEVIKREIIEVDEDDVSNIEIPYHELKKVGVPLTVHEQNDGTYYAMGITGTTTKDSALAWIRYLQKTNPILSKVAVVFKLRSSTDDTLVDQADADVRLKNEPQKHEDSAQR